MDEEGRDSISYGKGERLFSVCINFAGFSKFVNFHVNQFQCSSVQF